MTVVASEEGEPLVEASEGAEPTRGGTEDVAMAMAGGRADPAGAEAQEISTSLMEAEVKEEVKEEVKGGGEGGSEGGSEGGGEGGGQRHQSKGGGETGCEL